MFFNGLTLACNTGLGCPVMGECALTCVVMWAKFDATLKFEFSLRILNGLSRRVFCLHVHSTCAAGRISVELRTWRFSIYWGLDKTQSLERVSWCRADQFWFHQKHQFHLLQRKPGKDVYSCPQGHVFEAVGEMLGSLLLGAQQLSAAINLVRAFKNLFVLKVSQTVFT